MKLYGEVNADFLAIIPSLISPECNVGLMKPFSKIEILDIIWAMEPDKDPGTDGFSIRFYRAYWKIIKTDLIRMVTTFQNKGKVGGCMNSTFLALIPKEVNPETFDRLDLFHFVMPPTKSLPNC